MKPAYWIIKCNRFDTTLGIDGKFYRMIPIENFKIYKREGNATRRLLKLGGQGFSAHAVHYGDTLDCCGRITKPSGKER